MTHVAFLLTLGVSDGKQPVLAIGPCGGSPRLPRLVAIQQIAVCEMRNTVIFRNSCGIRALDVILRLLLVTNESGGKLAGILPQSSSSSSSLAGKLKNIPPPSLPAFSLRRP
ncbi:hypothetical protein LshimejAT787_0905580 [Lyophyllum shimeji]|uniref:Uncharacterized protein n=1 Tax=Lyophyllum shimeji TaxID=47721 RepID=A0A9P3PTK8_LYOSH|nr:hypothetical protein LshimejAT787_0905580 [Lyophyllum shimeji]